MLARRQGILDGVSLGQSTVHGFVLPGYVNASSWNPGDANHATAMALPGQVAGLGANSVAVQTLYTTQSYNSTDVTAGSGTVSDQGLAAMVTAAKAAGLKVSLKPHLQPVNGPQDSWCPGAQFSLTSYDSNGTSVGRYATNSSLVSAPGSAMNLTTVNQGDRVVTPSIGHFSEIPNSGYSTPYATGPAPAYSTVTAVTGANNFTLADANGTTIQAGATSTNAYFIVLHDADAETWFSNWQATLLHLLSVAQTAGGADSINLSTEHDLVTRYYPTQWRTLIAAIRSAHPLVKVFVSTVDGGSDAYYGDVPFWDACDYIGIDAYPTVGSAGGGDSQSVVNANWANFVSGMPAYAAAWNKRIVFGEVGARSIVGAGYQPYAYSSATAQNPDTDQAAFINGLFSACANQPWFGGFFWWTWFARGDYQGPYIDTTSYEPKALSQAVFQNQFGA